MILRPASPTDVPALADFGRRAFTDVFGHLYAAENLAAFLAAARSEEKVASQVEDPECGVMLAVGEEEAILGYCMVRFDEGFAEGPAPQPLRPCFLSQLYCARAATGRGIGTRLMEWAIAEACARDRDAMQLSVYSENPGAQRFYQRFGFRKIAEIGFWVGDHRDDEYLYELSLPR